MMTVTSVDTAADMRTAVVYLAYLDDQTSVVLERSVGGISSASWGRR